jgi:hypothetical protein
MYIIATVTLVIALLVLLILGFLRVARELLSRSICEVPSSHEVGFQRTTEARSAKSVAATFETAR